MMRAEERRPRHARSDPAASIRPTPRALGKMPGAAARECAFSPVTSQPSFAALGLAAPLLRALADEGYTEPTPVQAQVIPHGLAGRDVLACAQTGTGKTAAFVLPILQRLAAAPRSRATSARSSSTPTRELAAQIAERVSAYGRHLAPSPRGHLRRRRASAAQEIALGASPDVLVATPGRLLDLMEQGLVRLDGVTHFVLDEADRMLDMGFVHDVRRVCRGAPARSGRRCSSRRRCRRRSRALAQRDARRSGARRDRARGDDGRDGRAVGRLRRQGRQARDARARPARAVRRERTLVFTRTKHGANRLSEQLDRAGIGSAAIHGNKTQAARERALESFRRGTTRRARRDRRRGARHRRRRHLARRQLRPAQRRRELRAPHRTDGARRGHRAGHLVLRERRAIAAARRRKAHPAAAPWRARLTSIKSKAASPRKAPGSRLGLRSEGDDDGGGEDRPAPASIARAAGARANDDTTRREAHRGARRRDDAAGSRDPRRCGRSPRAATWTRARTSDAHGRVRLALFRMATSPSDSLAVAHALEELRQAFGDRPKSLAGALVEHLDEPGARAPGREMDALR